MGLLPRDERFFDMFTSVATLNLEAARHLRALLEADEDHRGHLADTIKRVEHQADDLTHEVVTRLDRSFITPLDREDIHTLASHLDTVVDLIDGIARRVIIFRAGPPSPNGAILLAGVIVRATEQLLAAVKVLEKGGAPVVIKACIEIKRLEEEGDSIYQEWLGRLFEERTDPITLIKWKEVYDNLERCLDHTEDVANVLESIAIKHS